MVAEAKLCLAEDKLALASSKLAKIWVWSITSTFYIKKMPKIYKALMIIMTLLVFASTVTVKQHVVADICGAIIVGEFGIFVSKKFIWKKLG